MKQAAGLHARCALFILFWAAVGGHPQKSDQPQKYDSDKNQIFHWSCLSLNSSGWRVTLSFCRVLSLNDLYCKIQTEFIFSKQVNKFNVLNNFQIERAMIFVGFLAQFAHGCQIFYKAPWIHLPSLKLIPSLKLRGDRSACRQDYYDFFLFNCRRTQTRADRFIPRPAGRKTRQSLRD